MISEKIMLDDAGLVRPLERHDLPVVAGLAARRALLKGDPLAVDPHELVATLRGPDARLTGLVAERFGHVVGYALIDPGAGGGEGPALAQLFVLEGSRGLGLGRRLVEAAAALARLDYGAGLSADLRGAPDRAGPFLSICGFVSDADGRVYRRAFA